MKLSMGLIFVPSPSRFNGSDFQVSSSLSVPHRLGFENMFVYVSVKQCIEDVEDDEDVPQQCNLNLRQVSAIFNRDASVVRLGVCLDLLSKHSQGAVCASQSSWSQARFLV